jgi:hypothetical protein
MIVSAEGLGPESDCSGKAQKQLYEQIADPSSRPKGHTTSRNPQLSDRKNNLVMSSRREPDTKTDWLTDRRLQLNFNFSLVSYPVPGHTNGQPYEDLALQVGKVSDETEIYMAMGPARL